MSTDALERQLDLVAFLLAARHPVPIGEIFAAFHDHYVGSDETRDRKFRRDKEDLAALGFPIEFIAFDAEKPDSTGGYLLHQEKLYLPDIHLSLEERAALFTVGAAAQAGAFPLRTELALALAKLKADGDAPDIYRRSVVTARRATVHEDLLARASHERRSVTLRYGDSGEARVVEPWVFVVRRGRASAIGFCRLRQGIRTFHADRITSCEWRDPKATKADFEVPADFDVRQYLPEHPWQIRIHAPVRVKVSFTPAFAEAGPRLLGLDADGCCDATHLDGLVSQVASYGGAARIVSPPDARERLRNRLSGLLETP